ncbi:hypothetical protein [Streptomyces sp. NPDC051572]
MFTLTSEPELRETVHAAHRRFAGTSPNSSAGASRRATSAKTSTRWFCR